MTITYKKIDKDTVKKIITTEETIKLSDLENKIKELDKQIDIISRDLISTSSLSDSKLIEAATDRNADIDSEIMMFESEKEEKAKLLKKLKEL